MDTPKESASSPTGRLPRDPEIQFLEPPKYLREIMELLADAQHQAMTITGLDFGRHDRPAAMLVSYKDGEMHAEFIDMFSEIRGQKADLIIIDDVAEKSPYNLDFSDLEMRALALMSQETINDAINPLVLGGRGHAKTETMRKMYRGFYHTDEEIARMQKAERKMRMRPKKDRDQSYLALDPTKSHRKRRR